MRWILLFLILIGFHSLQGQEEKFLLVTGCARSGTVYITKVMQQCGIDIHHEYIGKHGVCSWLMAVDDETAPYGPGSAGIRFQHVLHQVRDPIKTISSVYTTENDKSWKYVIKHIPQIQWSDPHIVKCAKYWYYWNLKAAQKADYSYCIENIEKEWSNIEEMLGLKLDKTALDRVPKNANTRGDYRRKITWNTLKLELDPVLYLKIRKLAEFYGYPTED
jgi:hypothetical protein